MPYPSPDPERILPSRASKKRKAADRREAEVLRLRAEADECDRRWQEYKERRRQELEAAS